MPRLAWGSSNAEWRNKAAIYGPCCLKGVVPGFDRENATLTCLAVNTLMVRTTILVSQISNDFHRNAWLFISWEPDTALCWELVTAVGGSKTMTMMNFLTFGLGSL